MTLPAWSLLPVSKDPRQIQILQHPVDSSSTLKILCILATTNRQCPQCGWPMLQPRPPSAATLIAYLRLPGNKGLIASTSPQVALLVCDFLTLLRVVFEVDLVDHAAPSSHDRSLLYRTPIAVVNPRLSIDKVRPDCIGQFRAFSTKKQNNISHRALCVTLCDATFARPNFRISQILLTRRTRIRSPITRSTAIDPVSTVVVLEGLALHKPLVRRVDYLWELPAYPRVISDEFRSPTVSTGAAAAFCPCTLRPRTRSLAWVQSLPIPRLPDRSALHAAVNRRRSQPTTAASLP